MTTKLKWTAAVLFVVFGLWATIHNGIEPSFPGAGNCAGPRAPLICYQR